MAAIDRDQLLADVKFWLPDQTTLSDQDILQIAELVIAQVGDDDQYYGEVFCKTLQACLEYGKGIHEGTSSGKRRERVGGVEVEVDDYKSSDAWQNRLDNLNGICPLYGYSPSTSSSTVHKVGGATIPSDVGIGWFDKNSCR